MGHKIAISSKNYWEDVIPTFKDNNNVLMMRDFDAVRINRGPTVDNIRSIAYQLRCPLSDVVYIDNCVYERNDVVKDLPEVNVPNWPDNSYRFAVRMDEVLKDINV
jgi:predicted enzyme involved in methoxymalonyl-ACP biosynthesis